MNNPNLVEDNMNLVYFLINKYYPTFNYDEDIIQCGMVGLCKAADTWDESNCTFSTYASKCILNEINMEFRRRRKNKTQLSLDYKVQTEDGAVEFGDLIVGKDDVDFVDIESIINKLTPREREVFSLLRNGASPSDITRTFGWSRQRTSKILRKIRLLWRNYNGY